MKEKRPYFEETPKPTTKKVTKKILEEPIKEDKDKE